MCFPVVFFRRKIGNDRQIFCGNWILALIELPDMVADAGHNVVAPAAAVENAVMAGFQLEVVELLALGEGIAQFMRRCGLFLGVHSVRIVANDWRTQVIAQRGEGAWKGLYSVLSIVGLVLVVWGYGLARQQPVVLWVPPVATRHIAALLTLVAFILLTAPYVPRNGIKARLHHPMVLGVKVWAFAHLLANGNLADVVLFGSFLLWAALSFRACARSTRGTTHATPRPTGSYSCNTSTPSVRTAHTSSRRST